MYFTSASLSTVGRDNSAKYISVQSEGSDDKRPALRLGQFCQINGGIVKKMEAFHFSVGKVKVLTLTGSMICLTQRLLCF